VLGGNMTTYTWTINGKAYPNRDSLDVKKGERVGIALDNPTAMSHPMHLHGHDFQVVEIDGQPLSGAVRDTLVIPPRSTMKVQFDADNPGLWAYHCHIIYHMVRGMFTVVKYDGSDTPFWQPEKTATELNDKLP
jgi:FtsP/CotA-like multicopper oxidase with cupredoxin domain